MRIIRTRLFSFLMVLCLFIGLLPTGALAADSTVLVDGTQLYSEAYAVLKIINQERAKVGLSPMNMSVSLLETAMLRSAEQTILAKHTRPNGENWNTAFPEGNFDFGENIAVGYASAADAMAAWMGSSGHKSNILNPKYNSVGVGCFEHNGVKYWTQDFSGEVVSNAPQPKDTKVSAKIDLGKLSYQLEISGNPDMIAGESQTVSVSYHNQSIYWSNVSLNPKGLTWTSSKPSVASVRDGVISALSEGTTVITAAAGINKVTITVHVTGFAVHKHTMEYISGKPASYLEDGVMAHWFCTVCEQRYTDQKGSAEVGEEDIVIPKLICTNHQWNNGVITTAPTFSESGIKTYTCNRCMETKEEIIPPNANVKLSHSGNLAVSKPSQAQLTAKWSEITSATNFFAAAPSVTAPYAIGKLSDEFINSGLTYLNFIRYAAGLPEVQVSDKLNEDAQHGAVVMAANNELSHYPKQPADMDNAFFKIAADATASSNISMRWGYENYNPLHSSTQGCVNDSSSVSNLQVAGHRRWLLNPTLGKVGFGYARSAEGADYITTKVFDRSGNDINYDFISWPSSGNFPNNVFDSDVPWSVTLNPNQYRAPQAERLSVVITRVSDNKSWTLNSSTGEPTLNKNAYLTVNNDGYGVANCIIFRPDLSDGESYNGSYTVSIKGLQTKDGTDTELNYQVDFFTLATCAHTYVEIPAVAPTCEEDGLTAGEHCSKCGEVTIAQTRIPALGHVQIVIPEVAATCEETGLSEGLRCEVCDKTLLEPVTVPALGHNYKNGICTRCESRDPSVTPTPEVTPTVKPEVTPEVTPTVKPEVTPEVTPTVKPEVTPEVTPTVKPEVTPEVTPTVKPEVTPEVTPTVKPEVTPEVTPTVKPEVTPEVTPTVKPEVTPEVTPTVKPEVTPEVTPTVKPEVTPEVTPTVKPEVTPEVTPTVKPEVTPEVTPTVKPEVTPEVTPTPPAADNPFIDVADKDWFLAPVLWAVQNNVTGGLTPNTFGPNASCTRAQVVTFLYAAAGKPEIETTDSPFIDVKSSDWFFKPVMWAVENGITGGLSPNTFGPNQTCTRAQVVTFLYASAGKPAPTSHDSPFTDVKNGDWYINPVLWAVENEVTGGIGNGQFGPNNTCTRAQVVTFLYKASQLEK